MDHAIHDAMGEPKSGRSGDESACELPHPLREAHRPIPGSLAHHKALPHAGLNRSFGSV